ncbi:SagB/ThcOx family dehydrogenase [Candidatus Thorarchaeota archaeon]|nr:MAG: SagB/ThcOx family dehydrogenase [Candidatus Thorarchaeota archaeon]
MDELRKILKADKWLEWETLRTHQKQKKDPPPLQKPVEDESKIISLPDLEKFQIRENNLAAIISARRSHRKFTGGALSLDELGFLLWSTQGIQKVVGNQGANLRTVPSGGGRHPFETYLVVFNVKDLPAGIYRYIPLSHALLPLQQKQNVTTTDMKNVCRNQPYFRDASVVFVWSCIPYRTFWRYSDLATKVIAQDSGHLCQNLYLASTAIGAGTCAIGAYYQEEMDNMLDLDGEEEFVIYLAPVGRIDMTKILDHDDVFHKKYST